MWRPLVVGGALAVAVVAGGFALERARLGATDTDALRRVEREVRHTIDDLSRTLERAAEQVAAERSIIAAARYDERAARDLFSVLDLAMAGVGPDPSVAITVYGEKGAPLAWRGRPSELLADRTGGPAAVFVAPGPLGLRLVVVRPVVEAAAGAGPPVGAVACERLLSARRRIGLGEAEVFTFPTSVVPVGLRPEFPGNRGGDTPFAFSIEAPDRRPLLEARVSPADLTAARRAWRRGVLDVALAILALAGATLVVPLLGRRTRAQSASEYLGVTAAVIAVVAVARGLLALLSPAPSPDGPSVSLTGAPRDLLLTSAAALAAVTVAADGVERWRIVVRRSRRPVRPVSAAWWLFVPMQLGVGAIAGMLALAYEALLAARRGEDEFGLLAAGLPSWDPAHFQTAVGLVVAHVAVFWTMVVTLRLGMSRWTLRRRDVVAYGWLLALWTSPLVAAWVVGRGRGWDLTWWPAAFVFAVAATVACLMPRGVARFRHAAHSTRLVLLSLAVVVPALVLYPSLVHLADHAKRRLVELEFAPQVANQRQEIQVTLRRSLDQIDALPALEDLAEAPVSARGPLPADAAYWVWSRTELSVSRVASAVEIYGRAGEMVSRFALNLAEYTRNPQTWREESCEWQLFEEVSPFGAEERRLLHAGRNLCRVEGGATSFIGTLVVHVMLDYNALPFLSSQGPYVELFRTGEPRSIPSPLGRDVEFAAYGWSRMPIFASGGAAWPIDEALFSRIYASRQPFWAEVARAGTTFHALVQNDRAGVYVLAYPALGVIGHLVNLAELTTLGAIAFLAILLVGALLRRIGGYRPFTGLALLREIRASFYRKLFLAFVAASLVPVVTLALVMRTYVVAQLRSDVESAAARTTAVAQRVIDDFSALQQRVGDGTGAVQRLGTGGPATFDDDNMVSISRVVGQDVNLYDGPRLVATSKRDLFASGLLPTRTPSAVYRAVTLEHRPSFIGSEQAGDFSYLLAAAPVGPGERKAVLTVPLATRQQEIEREINQLDRRILLATLLFILCSAAIGYTLAERIADPVNRLTRAARRIARGDLDARTALTSSDELGRLVSAFNSMAADLARQRTELERTHRLEAWAEMARQVAHEIKNPLTPIQLSAEHLRRVHEDRGRPLDPALEECVDAILAQVRLLRQISGEFSSFASSPTPRPAAAALGGLVEEVVAPYRVGAGDRVRFVLEIPADLPPAVMDRTLVGRALANLVDNALHAMPGGGTLTLRAGIDPADASRLHLQVTDTGIGLDPDALDRIFEPYFSTKAVGTGLGLTIARRNIELNGGTIRVDSEKGKGTTVTLTLPLRPPD